MRGGHDPDVHVQRPLAADPLECAVLEDPQQPHLRGRRELAALVEEEGAPVRPLEPSLPRPDRPREAAALVAEQLGVDQVGRDGAAVDAQEGARRPPRTLVDRPGHDLLARPRLAQDQDRRVRVGDQLDLLHHRLQAGLGADDRVADVVAVESRQQRALVRLERLAERRPAPAADGRSPGRRRTAPAGTASARRARRAGRGAAPRPGAGRPPVHPGRGAAQPAPCPRAPRAAVRAASCARPGPSPDTPCPGRTMPPALPARPPRRPCGRPPSPASRSARPETGPPGPPSPRMTAPGRADAPGSSRSAAGASGSARAARSTRRSRCVGRPPSRRRAAGRRGAPWRFPVKYDGSPSKYHRNPGKYHGSRQVQIVASGSRAAVWRDPARSSGLARDLRKGWPW